MFPPGRRIAVLACALGICWCAEPAGQRGDLVQPPWADPEAMFEAMFEAIFGEEGEVDAKTLVEIEISPREERQIGKQAADAYSNQFKAQGLRVVRRGKDVEYLRSLVDKLHPLMSQRERYPEIEMLFMHLDLASVFVERGFGFAPCHLDGLEHRVGLAMLVTPAGNVLQPVAVLHPGLAMLGMHRVQIDFRHGRPPL